MTGKSDQSKIAFGLGFEALTAVRVLLIPILAGLREASAVAAAFVKISICCTLRLHSTAAPTHWVVVPHIETVS